MASLSRRAVTAVPPIATLLLSTLINGAPAFSQAGAQPAVGKSGTPAARKASPASGTRRRLAQNQSTSNQPVHYEPTEPVPPPDQLPLRGTPIKDNAEQLRELQKVEQEATVSSGAIFVTPEKINVKPPVLTALITLDRRFSPYDLDAMASREITLHDVLETALLRNLDIKIVNQDSVSNLWSYRSSLGNFLPDLANEVSFQGLNGTYVSPVGIAIPIKNPYLNMSSGFNWYLFKGGSIIHGMMQAKDTYKASKFALKGTINDVLYEATKLYYQLALNDALLQVRVKGVQVARGQVLVNQDQYDFGVITQLDVLQAKYQLADDRQKLIKQQIDRRQAAVNLATSLNQDQGVDLTIKDRLVRKIRLVDERMLPADLLKIALDTRPELKRYEQLRLAAKEAVKVARASLMPTVAGTGNVIGTGSNVFRNSPFSSNSSSTAATPLATGGTGIGPVSGTSGLPLSGTSSGPKRWSTRSLFTIGIDMQWNLGGLGYTEAANIQMARSNARKAQLEFNKQLNKIYGEVRDAYLSSIRAENLIIETTDAVKYAEEALRLAQLRFKEGVGTYVDVLIAQRNYIAALVNKATAIIDFNIAQANILHSIGRVSVSTLTSATPLRE